MAECSPHELPRGKSGVAGERKVFAWLRDLPDDCIVYYEPVTGRRYPDFVVILPTLGVLVVEVKSWPLADLRDADAHSFRIASASGKSEMVQAHPVRQARDYVLALMEVCASHLWGRCLRWEEGSWRGKFRFPFAHAVVLTEVRRAEIEALPALAELLPAARVLTADELAAASKAEPAEKLAVARRFFDLFQPTEPLGPAQIAALRAIIHPEIRIGAPTQFVRQSDPATESLKVLDLAQERAALEIGGGHRLVFGAAGSGKTVMLLARARLLATQRPEAKILVLCYNVTLAAYLARNLREFGERVQVINFHKILHRAGIAWRGETYEVDPNALGLELLRRRHDDEADSRYFDALFIDEAQDFAPSWFQAALGLVKQPDEADVFIVGDGNQGIFGTGKRRFKWASVGIHASGRTLYLKRPYRSSREIIALASHFAAAAGDDDDGVAPIAAVATLAARSTGFGPWLLRARTRAEETDKALRLVQELLAGSWRGRKLDRPLAPEDIAILYPRLEPAVKPEFERLRRELQRLQIRYNWLSADGAAKEGIGTPGVRLQTIHGSKGLQYRAVILLWVDLLPRTWGEHQDRAADRLLLYVGLTRAEDFLAVLTSGESAFVDELRAAAAQGGH